MDDSLVIRQSRWSDFVAEDVDKDARDADLTYNLKDELMLLAGPGDDRFFRKELDKVLQSEQKVGEEMQQMRRLNHFGLLNILLCLIELHNRTS